MVSQKGLKNEWTGRRAIEEAFGQSTHFLKRIFSDHETDHLERAPGSFAFMVPPRVRCEVDGRHDSYVQEWRGLCSILKYVDSNVAQRFLAGIPPFIVDQYGVNAAGALLCRHVH